MLQRKHNKKVAIKYGFEGARELILHSRACEFVHRLHLLEDSATALLLVSCTHRCSGQGGTGTFLLRFRPLLQGRWPL
jgi:hypothetical protein